MVTGDVVVRMIMADLVLQWFFHGQGDMAAAEIIVVRKYCDAITFFAFVESGKFLYMAPCHVTVLYSGLTGSQLIELMSKRHESR